MPLKSIEFNFPIYRDGKEVRKCDEGTGNELKDSSPNQNHVTLGGTPQWSEQINFSHPKPNPL